MRSLAKQLLLGCLKGAAAFVVVILIVVGGLELEVFIGWLSGG